MASVDRTQITQMPVATQILNTLNFGAKMDYYFQKYHNLNKTIFFYFPLIWKNGNSTYILFFYQMNN